MRGSIAIVFISIVLSIKMSLNVKPMCQHSYCKLNRKQSQRHLAKEAEKANSFFHFDRIETIQLPTGGVVALKMRLQSSFGINNVNYR